MKILNNMVFARLLILALALLPCIATALSTDLASSADFNRNCASVTPNARELKNNKERQTFVICRDVKLVKNIVTFFTTGLKKIESNDKPGADLINAILREQLTLVRNELRTVREVLEQTKLKKEEGLLLAPAQWHLDLDGDGKIKIWESFFFAIPKQSPQSFHFRMPSDSPDYYVNEYQLDAKIRVDQSDILWALSYHYFAESLMEILLSYQLKNSSFNRESIELYDPEGMQRAGQLLTKGFQTSEAMRVSVLAEKTDDFEWISNPTQKQSVFPMRLDAQDFEIWGAVLKHVIPLFQGETLLVAEKNSAGVLAAIAKICPANTGLSIPAFFKNPPRYPMDLMNSQFDLSHMCQPVDKKFPASGLLSLIEKYGNNALQNNGAAMGYLRQLLWVN